MGTYGKNKIQDYHGGKYQDGLIVFGNKMNNNKTELYIIL